MVLKEFVKSLVDTHGTNNPFTICDCLNIKVKYIDVDNIRGLATTVFDSPVIFLNKKLQGFNKAFVLSHELCHILRHDIHSISFSKRHTLQKADVFEKEANAFAALLLLDPATDSYIIGSEPLDDDVKREITERIQDYY